MSATPPTDPPTAETDAIAIPTICIGCGHPDPTGGHIAGCAEAQRKMAEPVRFTPIEKPEATCPVHGCGADLYLTLMSCIPLYEVDPPWPGADEATYDPSDAVSDGWEVCCTDDHRVWTHVDQIRADNAAGLTDDDETGDTAPRFRMDLLHSVLREVPACTHDAAWIEEGDESGSSGWWRCAACGHAEQVLRPEGER